MDRTGAVDFYAVALALVLLLGLFLSLYFFYGPSPINGADNYLYTDFGHYLSVGNFRMVAHNGVLAQQYILDAGIALFFVLLSPSRLSASLFGVVCFLLTIFLLFKMGELLYNKKAGLLAAFLYSFSPMAVINSSYVGDNGPMALFVTLCVYCLAIAIKERKNDRSNKYYMLCGFFGLISILTTSQGIIILVVPIIALAFYAIKFRDLGSAFNIGYFGFGLIIAFAVIAALGVAGGFGPFYIFTLNSDIYGSTPWAHPQFQEYIIYVFPFGVLDNASRIAGVIHATGSFSAAGAFAWKWLFDAGSFNYPFYQTIGLFGYFGVLSALYLLLRRSNKLWLPVLWFVATLLYLSYGTVSITRYAPIGYSYSRFALMFLPALTLIIAFAIADAMDFGRDMERKKRGADAGRIKAVRYILVAVVAIGVAVLFANSILAIRFVDLSQYEYVAPLIETANFINSLPTNATIYVYMTPVWEYTNFSRNLPSFDPGSCNSIVTPSYVIEQYNETLAARCDLKPIFRVYQQQGFSSYNLFNDSSFGTYYNTTVYFHG